MVVGEVRSGGSGAVQQVRTPVILPPCTATPDTSPPAPPPLTTPPLLSPHFSSIYTFYTFCAAGDLVTW